MCKFGMQESVEWLVTKYWIKQSDVQTDDNIILRTTCTAGRLHVAKWLVRCFQLSTIDARAHDDEILRYVCSHNMAEMAEWMIGVFYQPPAVSTVELVALLEDILVHIPEPEVDSDPTRSRSSLHGAIGEIRLIVSFVHDLRTFVATMKSARALDGS